MQPRMVFEKDYARLETRLETSNEEKTWAASTNIFIYLLLIIYELDALHLKKQATNLGILIMTTF